jgi:hypothetical protein
MARTGGFRCPILSAMSNKHLPDIFKPKGVRAAPEADKRSVFGALARTAARLQEREAALREASAAAALAKIERRFTPHLCAVTGERWMTEWRKAPGEALFTRHEAVKLSEASQSTTAAEAQGGGDFAISEFDGLSGLRCLCCGHERLRMFCDCGLIVCGGKSEFFTDKPTMFHCHQSCGQSFRVSGAATISPGYAAPPARPALAAGKGQGPALPNPSAVLQLPDHSKSKR